MRISRVGENAEREIAGRLGMIRFEGSIRTGELVLQTVIGPGMEMAGRAGRSAVAANLHVPEQRLAGHEESFAVADVPLDSSRLRNQDFRQRTQLLRMSRVNGCGQNEEITGARVSNHKYPSREEWSGLYGSCAGLKRGECVLS
jgi:hypothetical protein